MPILANNKPIFLIHFREQQRGLDILINSGHFLFPFYYVDEIKNIIK